jgi:hypothetical protein
VRYEFPAENELCRPFVEKQRPRGAHSAALKQHYSIDVSYRAFSRGGC